MTVAASLSFKSYGGMMCARGELVCGDRTVAAHVLIELGAPVSLLVHENTAQMMGIGRGTPVTLKFGELTLGDLSATPSALKVLEDLTQNYAEEMGEVPAVAILGLGALAGHTVELDIPAGRLSLLSRPLAEIMADPALGLTETELAGKSWVLPFRVETNGYWLDGQAGDEYQVRVRFSTATADTVIDAVTADLAGAPGGNLASLALGGLELTGYVALRPEDLTGQTPPPDVILGTDLLKHFRLTIDVDANRVWFLRTVAPVFPRALQDYYLARYEEDANSVERFVTENPAARQCQEAALLLYRLRLEDFPPEPQAAIRAAGLYVRTVKPGQRARRLMELADSLLDGGQTEWAAVGHDLLNRALAAAPDDTNAVAPFQIRARLGRLCVMEGDYGAARRYLLAAVFGMPRDPFVNYWLGVLYEKTGKPSRAWSRYLAAALAQNAPPEAMQAVGRLNNQPEFRAQFSMADAEQILEGRMLEYHPATVFSQDPGAAGATPVRLIELFTCIDQPASQAAELAFNGLREYFAGEPVSLVAWHLALPAPDPLVHPTGAARAAFYGVESTPFVVMDGGQPLAAAGDETQAEAIFTELKQAALRGVGARPAGWTLTGRAAIRDETLAGEFRMKRPPDANGDEVRLIVLAGEKRVMAPGANGILFHRQVSRQVLTAPSGWPVPGDQSVNVFEFDLTLAELAGMLEANLAGAEAQHQVRFHTRPTHLDRQELMVIAILYQPDSRAVLAAVTLEIDDQSGQKNQ